MALFGPWMDGNDREVNSTEKKGSLCAESCSDEINKLVQMKDRRGQRELGRKMKTITLLHPPGASGRRSEVVVLGRDSYPKALLALKFRALVPAFIAPDVLSHNPLHSLSFFSFLYLKVSQSWVHACMNFSLTLHITLQEGPSQYVCARDFYMCVCVHVGALLNVPSSSRFILPV